MPRHNFEKTSAISGRCFFAVKIIVPQNFVLCFFYWAPLRSNGFVSNCTIIIKNINEQNSQYAQRSGGKGE